MFEVTNQPPPLEPYNVFASDTVLREAVKREQAGWAEDGLKALGATLGKPETVKLGFDANKYTPTLRTLDRYGHRIDEVEFHPAWHELLAIALRAGLHSSPWAEPKAGAHVARAAGFYLLMQIESGVCCPLAMTYGSVPALRQAPEIAAHWLPKIYGRQYDRRFRPVGEKSAALIGMGMTENQGGSDLRTNVTRAEPVERRQLPAIRPQMVHVGADVRRLPGAGAVAERFELLPDAALDAGGEAQRHPYPSPQGQARQPLQCLQRSRVRRRLCAADRRGGPRHPDHHRDGQLHPARLRHRLLRPDAAGAGAGACITPAIARPFRRS